VERRVAYKGARYTIAFAQRTDGSSPAYEFFTALSLEDKAKLMKLIQLFADHGPLFNKEKFGDLGDGMYEFKSFQIRMPFAYASQRGLILITHGFYKK